MTNDPTAPTESPPPEASHEEPPPEELHRRVLYSLLGAAVRVARTSEVRAVELKEWVQLAYFHELREQGLTMREVSEWLDVSMRTAANLASRLKLNFLDPERDEGLPRRIEFMLWAGPLSEARLCQVLPAEDPETVAAALRALVASGRVEERGGPRVTYAVTQREHRLVRDRWLARIDGLNHLVAAVAQSTYGRFFAEDERAFARTVGLRVRASDVARLREFYEEQLWPLLSELDEAAREDETAEPFDVALCWAPSAIIPDTKTKE